MTTSNPLVRATVNAAEEIRITAVEPFLLHVPVTGEHIADSMHSVTHWGMPGVMIHTDSGLCGYGYTGTHAHRASDLLITDCISKVYAPLLLGEPIHDVLALWKKMYHFPPAQWVGRAGITQLALAAVDIERVREVRRAIGPRAQLTVDANGRCDLPSAIELGRYFEELEVSWFEEPMWYEDVEGHRRLAQSIRTPIALGEQLYSLDAFAAFVRAGAVHFLQPDATRIGGISEFWQVADLALAHRLPVAPHAGDMMQVHLQMALAHPACVILEYIPWTLECFREPAQVKEGRFTPPQLPGAGTELRADAFNRFGVQPT